MALQFEWDPEKAESNLKKHKIRFEEASTVFADPLAKLFHDDDDSIEENREILIGLSLLGRLLLVSFTERGQDLVRIISARAATRNERKRHEENQDV